MVTYRLVVEYDGTDFSGWQVQRDRRTAMGELRASIAHVTGETPAMTAAGRTDAGAHAHGQVVGFSLQRAWEPRQLHGALNAHLPADITVTHADIRADGFDARHDAMDRTYRYLVVNREGHAPVVRRHAWVVRGPLDVDAMRAAAAHLVGTHDFSAFGRSPREQGSTVRTVHEVSVERSSLGDPEGPNYDTTVITVRADAFLRGMMRAFTGALVRVGQGRATPEWLGALVAHDESATTTAVPVAPARGLHQWSVRYEWDPVAAKAERITA